jgi:hypothetical protein
MVVVIFDRKKILTNTRWVSHVHKHKTSKESSMLSSLRHLQFSRGDKKPHHVLQVTKDDPCHRVQQLKTAEVMKRPRHMSLRHPQKSV